MELIVKDTHHILNKEVLMEFAIYEDTLEMMISDSNDFTLYGYETVEEFVKANISKHNKEILIKHPYSTEMIRGGRLDILYRTHDFILTTLKDLYWKDNLEVSLLDRLADYLYKIDFDDNDDFLEDLHTLYSLEDALQLLGYLKQKD